MHTESMNQHHNVRPQGPGQLHSSTGRPQAPVSISEAARRASAPSNGKKRRVSPTRNTEFDRREFLRQSSGSSRLQICQTSTPLTPSLDPGPGGVEGNGCRRGKNISRRHTRQSNMDVSEAHDTAVSDSELIQSEGREDASFETIDDGSVESTPGTLCSSRPKVQASSDDSADVNESSIGSSTSGLGLTTPFARPRLAALDTTAAQDMSLPSPSLSPVTAAANLQNRRSYFDDSSSQIRIGPLALSSPPHEGTDEEDMADVNMSMLGLWPEEKCTPNDHLDTVIEPPHQLVLSSTMMDMPNMLDSFEAMPSEMKKYLMYQLLRRCPKPVLHFVAGTVNPALKCDFLTLLPSELCQNIIGHIDVRSLCRAAQVSRKWRQVIDTDEKSWKNLFDARGFVMPPGELQRAIREGWGWQYGSGGDDWDKDLSEPDGIVNFEGLDYHAVIPAPVSGQQMQSAQMKRPKRKAPSKPRTSSRKQQKKRDVNPAAVAQYDYDALMKLVSSADGPYGAARAAAIAVPYSKVGSPGLRQLHLYKSIYRRHHLISSYWMQDKIEPKHLAFKAHQRHVVTCLQFDSDKILTGSDDTNINVYDTQTGALRARLEGHEGGVWALQYQGNVLVSGSTDRSVRVWDIKKGVCTHVFQGHTSTVRCLVILMPTTIDIAPDGRPIRMPREPLIITGSRDSNLRVWRLPEDGDPPFMQAGPPQDETDCPYFVRALTGHHHSVRAIAAHGDTLVSGSYDCTVRVWKISTGETVHRLQGHTQKVYSVVLDHERNRCISGSMDNLVKVWSLDTGSVLYTLEGHSSLVGLLDLQQDRLVSAAADFTLRIWEPETGICKSLLKAHTGAITCFQHDGQKVISGSDRTLKMWDVKDGKFVRDLLTDLSGVWQVKFDGRRCVAAVQRNNLTYIEVSTDVRT